LCGYILGTEIWPPLLIYNIIYPLNEYAIL
jgi:hypothetical protein